MITPHDASIQAEALCRMAPVIPVIVVHDVAQAVPLARALVAGGLPVLEVTLRTPAALEAIAAMAGVEGGIVGAGTLLSPADVSAAVDAGARFGVSPGTTPALLDACEAAGLPLLPGVATASEAMAMLDRGYRVQKYFPAEVAGGVAGLRALGAPIPQIGFCPTGGIGPGNVAAYLALPNVLCVGGSWVVPADRIAAGDWDGIQRLAAEAAALPRASAQA